MRSAWPVFNNRLSASQIQRGVVLFGLGGGYLGRAGAAGGAVCCVLAQARQARIEQAGYYRLPVLFLLR